MRSCRCRRQVTVGQNRLITRHLVGNQARTQHQQLNTHPPAASTTAAALLTSTPLVIRARPAAPVAHHAPAAAACTRPAVQRSPGSGVCGHAITPPARAALRAAAAGSCGVWAATNIGVACAAAGGAGAAGCAAAACGAAAAAAAASLALHGPLARRLQVRSPSCCCSAVLSPRRAAMPSRWRRPPLPAPRHPLDQQNTSLVRALPGMELVAKTLMGAHARGPAAAASACSVHAPCTQCAAAHTHTQRAWRSTQQSPRTAHPARVCSIWAATCSCCCCAAALQLPHPCCAAATAAAAIARRPCGGAGAAA